MEILAIIPARGGSKGIPGKNIQPLAGIPLISHTIGAAEAALLVNRVVVSTDDPDIEEVARKAGADICHRPADISGDMASSEDALLHTLSILANEENYYPDVLVFLQCTSPLTLKEDIEGTIEQFLDKEADTAVSVSPFHYFLWQEDESGEAHGINHDKIKRPLRQERNDQFLENGAIYVMKTEGFLKYKHRFFGKTVMYVMPEERCHEIDDPVDMHIAEAMMAFKK